MTDMPMPSGSFAVFQNEAPAAATMRAALEMSPRDSDVLAELKRLYDDAFAGQALRAVREAEWKLFGQGMDARKRSAEKMLENAASSAKPPRLTLEG
jgi:hypothetical protein